MISCWLTNFILHEFHSFVLPINLRLSMLTFSNANYIRLKINLVILFVPLWRTSLNGRSNLFCWTTNTTIRFRFCFNWRNFLKIKVFKALLFALNIWPGQVCENFLSCVS
jgi:hypothetical protein